MSMSDRAHTDLTASSHARHTARGCTPSPLQHHGTNRTDVAIDTGLPRRKGGASRASTVDVLHPPCGVIGVFPTVVREHGHREGLPRQLGVYPTTWPEPPCDPPDAAADVDTIHTGDSGTWLCGQTRRRPRRCRWSHSAANCGVNRSRQLDEPDHPAELTERLKIEAIEAMSTLLPPQKK